MSAKPRTTKPRKPAARKADGRFAQLTESFIAAIESGAADPNGWRMPWNRFGNGGAPRNIESRKRYSGMNHLLLALAAAEAGAPALFATYKQMSAKHLQVRAGETGHLVVRWIEVGKRDADGAPEVDDKGRQRTFMVPKVFVVFGIWQVDDAEGYDGAKARQLARFGFTADGAPVEARSEAETIEAAEQLFAALGAKVVHGGDSAHYSIVPDVIHLPERAQFTDAIAYTSTKGHEFVHWTGAKGRCERPGIVDFDHFGSEQYAAEELVAELGAAFLGNLLGYATEAREDHADYLAHWVAHLRSDDRALLRAAKQAESAVAWMAERAGLDLGDDIPEDTEAEAEGEVAVALAA